MNGNCIRAMLASLAFFVVAAGLSADASGLAEADLAPAPAGAYRTATISEKSTVTGDLTVPYNVALRLEGSGAVQVEAGRTLTIANDAREEGDGERRSGERQDGRTAAGWQPAAPGEGVLSSSLRGWHRHHVTTGARS